MDDFHANAEEAWTAAVVKLHLVSLQAQSEQIYHKSQAPLVVLPSLRGGGGGGGGCLDKSIQEEQTAQPEAGIHVLRYTLVVERRQTRQRSVQASSSAAGASCKALYWASTSRSNQIRSIVVRKNSTVFLFLHCSDFKVSVWYEYEKAKRRMVIILVKSTRSVTETLQ